MERSNATLAGPLFTRKANDHNIRLLFGPWYLLHSENILGKKLFLHNETTKTISSAYDAEARYIGAKDVI